MMKIHFFKKTSPGVYYYIYIIILSPLVHGHSNIVHGHGHSSIVHGHGHISHCDILYCLEGFCKVKNKNFCKILIKSRKRLHVKEDYSIICESENKSESNIR
jgi:hypothetical protein